LIISSSDYQVNHNHCVLQSAWIDDITITNIITAGVSSPSKIIFKIFSLDVCLILDKLGCLIDEDKLSVQLK
jgi:hypothetical protein